MINPLISNPPAFLVTQAKLSSPEEFRPPPPDRRGERIAWLCTLLLGITIVIIASIQGEIPSLSILLFIIFGLAGALISFANWIESNTRILLSSEGVNFHSPLRNVALHYSMIESLWASEIGSGWRIGVLGGGERFTFRTAIRITGPRGRSIPFGIKDGKRLGALLRSMANLSSPEMEDGIWICQKVS